MKEIVKVFDVTKVIGLDRDTACYSGSPIEYDYYCLIFKTKDGEQLQLNISIEELKKVGVLIQKEDLGK